MNTSYCNCGDPKKEHYPAFHFDDAFKSVALEKEKKVKEPENIASWAGFDELVRDFTSQGFMAKSEARRRFGEIIADARKEERSHTIADCIEIVEEFILDPDCGENPDYPADQCTPTCGQNFAAKEIKKRLKALTALRELGERK
jgi:hypothetical protein